MLEKNGLLPVTTAEITQIRKGTVPERLAKEPWNLNLKEAEEMLDEVLGYTRQVESED